MAEKQAVDPQKRNNLKTKLLPSLFMLLGGSVTLIYGLVQEYPMTELLLAILIAMLIFAIIGTVIKSIIDKFNMKMNYADYIEEAGDLVEKGNNDDFG